MVSALLTACSGDSRQPISFTPEGYDPDGITINYSWKQIKGTTVSLLLDDSQTLLVTVSDINSDEILTFKFVSTDDTNAPASGNFHFNIRAGNKP